MRLTVDGGRPQPPVVPDTHAVPEPAGRTDGRSAPGAGTTPGLPHRRGWDRWIGGEEDRFHRFGDPASVVVLDLDLIEQVTDTRGRDAGDRHIRSAADVLRGCVRAGDALARLGGDEFAVVVVRTGADGA